MDIKIILGKTVVRHIGTVTIRYKVIKAFCLFPPDYPAIEVEMTVIIGGKEMGRETKVYYIDDFDYILHQKDISIEN